MGAYLKRGAYSKVLAYLMTGRSCPFVRKQVNDLQVVEFLNFVCNFGVSYKKFQSVQIGIAYDFSGCYIVLLCFTALCYITLWNIMECYVMLCHVMSCYVMLCHVMLCHVMSCYVMLCYVMLCYVFLCSDMLCYVML